MCKWDSLPPERKRENSEQVCIYLRLAFVGAVLTRWFIVSSNFLYRLYEYTKKNLIWAPTVARRNERNIPWNVTITYRALSEFQHFP